jgi:hypothetical protein
LGMRALFHDQADVKERAALEDEQWDQNAS